MPVDAAAVWLGHVAWTSHSRALQRDSLVLFHTAVADCVDAMRKHGGGHEAGRQKHVHVRVQATAGVRGLHAGVMGLSLWWGWGTANISFDDRCGRGTCLLCVFTGVGNKCNESSGRRLRTAC